MAHLSRFTALLVGITLAACGGKSFDAGGGDSGGGGSSSQGNTGNVAASGSGGDGNVGGTGQVGGTGHAGSTPNAGSSAGGTAQGGQPGDACDAFKDDAGAYISVEILNDTANVIYLGSQEADCGDAPLFAVENGDGKLLPQGGLCRLTCDTSTQGGCPTICRQPYAIALKPGESYTTSWDGLDYVQTRLPKECTTPGSVTECTRAVRIEPGKFTFSSIAASGVECSLSSTPCDVCQASGNGGCIINGALLSDQLSKAATSVVLDSSYGIYPKAAPAPGDAPAPGGSGAIALPSVVIVFH